MKPFLIVNEAELNKILNSGLLLEKYGESFVKKFTEQVTYYYNYPAIVYINDVTTEIICVNIHDFYNTPSFFETEQDISDLKKGSLTNYFNNIFDSEF